MLVVIVGSEAGALLFLFGSTPSISSNPSYKSSN